MNAKTAISALQELMACAAKPLPQYQENGFDNTGLFSCSVSVNGITATGLGITKKAAKHASAENALTLLGKQATATVVLQVSTPLQSRPKLFKNFVGELNEYCSKSGVGYADYGLVAATVDGKFVMRCGFAGMETQGVGSTKKDAKQEAARVMFEKVKSGKVTSTAPSNGLKARFEVDDDKIAELFNKLSADFNAKRNNNNITSTNKNSAILEPSPDIRVDIEDLAELKKELAKNGIDYCVHWFQSDPYGVTVNIKNSAFTTLGIGPSENSALTTALQDLLRLKKSGCCLNDEIFKLT